MTGRDGVSVELGLDTGRLAAALAQEVQLGTADIAAGFAVLALMIAATRPGIIGNVLSGRLIGSIGIASYSFYLLHGSIGNRLLAWIGNPLGLPAAGCGLYPVAVLIAFILCSQVIYRVWETPMNRLIVSRLLKPLVRTPG